MVDKVIYHTERKDLRRHPAAFMRWMTPDLKFYQVIIINRRKKTARAKMEFFETVDLLGRFSLMLKETATSLLCEDFFVFNQTEDAQKIPVFENRVIFARAAFLCPSSRKPN